MLLNVLAASAATAPVVLGAIEVESDGPTSSGLVRLFLDLRPGDRFSSREALEAAVERERQDLVNRRAFASVTARLVEVEGRVEVRFQLRERVALLPLPYVLFDSNVGTELGLDVRYRNAFGTLTDWVTNPYLRINGDGEADQWRMGLAVQSLKIGRWTYGFQLQQRRELSQGDNPDGTPRFDFRFESTTIGLSVARQLHTQFWSVRVGPAVTLRYGFEDRLGTGLFPRDTVTAGLGLAGGYRRVDWRGHAREGVEVLGRGRFDGVVRDDVWLASQTLGLELRLYRVWGERFSYYAWLGLDGIVQGANPTQGRRLRGIRDRTMVGNFLAHTNHSVGVELLGIDGLVHLELHPFVDLGFVVPDARIDFVPELRVGAGTDVVLVLEFIGGFILRTTVGFDLGRLSGEPEVLVGVGHFY